MTSAFCSFLWQVFNIILDVLQLSTDYSLFWTHLIFFYIRIE